MKAPTIISLFIILIITSACYAQNTAKAADGDIAVGMKQISIETEDLYECPTNYRWDSYTEECEECDDNCTS